MDGELEVAQNQLTRVSEKLGDANESPTQRVESLTKADVKLKETSKVIAATHQETRETPLAFIGLQLVNLGRTHLTPARDRVIGLLRNPGTQQDGERMKVNALDALDHVVQSREFIASVRTGLETNNRDEKLAEELEEIETMYRIYIENTQQLLRRSMTSRNPLKRKMAIVEVDEAYLKRRTEVAVIARRTLANDSPTDVANLEDHRSSLSESAIAMTENADRLVSLLESMEVEVGDGEDEQSYLAERLAEANQLAARSAHWQALANGIQHAAYHHIAASDQRQLSDTSKTLLTDLGNLQEGIEDLFQREELSLPDDIRSIIVQLNESMNAATMHQMAAEYDLTTESYESASGQLQRAVERFEESEELFDQIRRMTVKILDEQDPDDPNAADLRDPTLDEFLARLEREPRLAQQLELGNRRQNLRVMSDWMLWQTRNGDMGKSPLKQAMANARKRIEQQNKEAKSESQKHQEPREDETNSKPAVREAESEQLREMLAQSIEQLEQMAELPETTPEQKQQPRKRMQQLQAMLDTERSDSSGQWRAMVESDRAKSIMRAIANGESLPDQQWNKLFSSLKSGLLQVRGRTPREAYRRAIEQYQEVIRQRVD